MITESALVRSQPRRPSSACSKTGLRLVYTQFKREFESPRADHLRRAAVCYGLGVCAFNAGNRVRVPAAVPVMSGSGPKASRLPWEQDIKRVRFSPSRPSASGCSKAGACAALKPRRSWFDTTHPDHLSFAGSINGVRTSRRTTKSRTREARPRRTLLATCRGTRRRVRAAETSGRTVDERAIGLRAATRHDGLRASRAPCEPIAKPDTAPAS